MGYIEPEMEEILLEIAYILERIDKEVLDLERELFDQDSDERKTLIDRLKRLIRGEK